MSEATTRPDLSLTIWALFLILVPFYFMGKVPVAPAEAPKWRSFTRPQEITIKVQGGVAQIADFVMLGLMALVFGALGVRLLPAHAPIVYVLGGFVCYVALVNLAWGAATDEMSLVYNTLFYVYNFVLFLTALTLYATFKEEFLRVTLHAIAASVFLQVLLSPVAPDKSVFRQALFFNNPNQVGYYAILAATLFFLGSRRFPLSVGYQVCFYAAVIYLNLLCLSKAALAAVAFLLVLVLLERPLTLLLGIGIAAVVLAGTFLVQDADSGLLSNLTRRMAVREADETWEGRGYDRIWNEPQYLFFGAGEGAYQRFRSVLNSELHSSLGNLLFSYGLIGLGLFGYGLFLICRGADLRLLLALVPTFIFGLFHPGLRFTLFWVLLAFFCCLTRNPRPDAAKALSIQESFSPEPHWPLAADGCRPNANCCFRSSGGA